MQDEMASLDNFGTIFLILHYDLSHDQRPHWGPRLLAIPSRPLQRVETSWGSTHSRLASSVLFGGLLPYAEPAVHNWCHRVRYPGRKGCQSCIFRCQAARAGQGCSVVCRAHTRVEIVAGGFHESPSFVADNQRVMADRSSLESCLLRAESPAAVSPLGTETGGGVTTRVVARRLNEGRLPSKKRQQSGRRKIFFSPFRC